MDFDIAFARLLGHEVGDAPDGGYTRDPRDPGGETKWGISKRANPDVDIANLTMDGAKAIYRRKYWDSLRLDRLPQALRFDLFDTAVNSGLHAAAILLQQAAGVTPDGIIGPLTLRAVENMPAHRVLARFNGWRLEMLADLPHWDRFGKGWARRIAANLRNA